ncbi:MAG: DUF2854 domain-containing protein [Cyanobacteriota bacterium]|nr:DUF2854 domain-containing protein [Cyanobacteriota bacterium]
MNALFSPGSLVTIAGAALTVVGSIAYLGDNANLSLPTIFYGIPILLGGLALKSSELPPPLRLTPADQFRELRQDPANADLSKLLGDLNRWRYGQKAHLESSLEALKLWDEDQPPQLLSVAEIGSGGRYGLELTFATAGVPVKRWQDQQARLGRFFGPGLSAELEPLEAGQLRLTLRSSPEAPASATPSSAAPTP